jgi:hypothetical protein
LLIKHDVIEVKEGRGPWEPFNHQSSFTSDADQDCNVALSSSCLTEPNPACLNPAATFAVEVEQHEDVNFSTVIPVAGTACEDTSALQVSEGCIMNIRHLQCQNNFSDYHSLKFILEMSAKVQNQQAVPQQ